jgi:formylglycine-generating enzyme required for sulfatase activity
MAGLLMNASGGENAFTIVETISKPKLFCVYKAKNYFRGNFVTIKTNEQRWRGDDARIRQLKNEAETGLKLKHPRIRETIGLFEEGGTVYQVTEYLEGDPLNAILGIPQVDIGLDQAVKWALQLLEALEYAHRHQILHLNLDPSNIIILPSYDLKVFGFGKPPHAWKTAEPDKYGFHPVLFTAPEVFLETNPDERSDLYSLGVLLYLVLTGKMPWALDRHESPSAQKQQIFNKPVLDPNLQGNDCPGWLFGILNKAMMIDPSRRFADASSMRAAILSREEIPFESSLSRPERSIIVEDHPRPVPASLPPAEIPEPIITPSRAAIKPEADIQPVAKQQVAPPARPQAPQAREPQDPDLPRLRHIFKILGIISLLIVAYILLKYVIIKDKPHFSHVERKDRIAQVRQPEYSAPNLPVTLINISGGKGVLGHIGPDAEDDEFPPRKVDIPSFSISPFEITREQWAMATPGYEFDEDEKDLPITNVSFEEVIEYCNAKSRLEGLQPCYEFLGNDLVCDFSASGYRLPTEAEWEYAAKARQRDDFNLYSGSDSPDEVGWYDSNSGDLLHPVGQKRGNSLGLYDMSGNAAEWVWNWYSSYTKTAETIFTGPNTGTDRVIRGGSYKDRPNELRVTNRYHMKPYIKSEYVGFRVVRSR